MPLPESQPSTSPDQDSPAGTSPLTLPNPLEEMGHPRPEVVGAGDFSRRNPEESQIPLLPLGNQLPRLAAPEITGYEMLRELGRGGMGVVYLARQQDLNRFVAIKMIRHAVWATPKEKARFQREAEALAQLQHPHIVQVHHLGSVSMPVEGDQPFMVLEYVPGMSLDQVLGGLPLPPRAAAGLLLTLAEAVQAAHAKGILHRDLKPGNVLLALPEMRAEPHMLFPLREALCNGTRAVQVKLSDFGLARIGSASLTTEGVAIGTPAYMAPEQAQAETDLTPAADVYSLGAVLYELLTGRPPFLIRNTLELFHQIRNQEPVSLSHLRAEIPADLNTICLKCLQKVPDRRYASAAALADDLRHFLEGRPISARPVGGWERAWRWSRRHPLTATLMATVAGLLVLSSVAAWSLAAWALGEKNRADVQARQAEANLAEARRAVDDCFRLAEQDMLFQAPAVREHRRRLLLAALPYYRRFREQARQSQLLTEEQADLCTKLAIIGDTVGDTREALTWSREACDLLERLSKQQPGSMLLLAKLAQAHGRMVTMQGDSGDLNAALAAFRRAEELWATVLAAAPDDTSYHYSQAKNWSGLGFLHIKQGRDAQARPWLEKALPVMRRLAAANPDNLQLQREVTNVGISLGMTLLHGGRKDEAATLLEQAKDHADRLCAALPTHLGCQQDLVQAWNCLSHLAFARGQPAEARRWLEQARQGSNRLLALFPRNVELLNRHAELLLGLSNAHARLGETETALTLLAEIKILRRRLQAEQPEMLDHVQGFAAACCNRGHTLGRLRKFAEAQAEYDQAEAALLPIVRSQPGLERAREFLFNTYTGRAELHSRQEQFAAAAQAWERALPLAPADKRRTVQQRRIIALSQSQEHAQAVTEAAALAREPNLDAAMWANLARVHVLAAETLPSADARREPWLRTALDFLRRAKEKGYPRLPSLRDDDDFTPLHDFPEWAKLFPAK